jgi:hypothetical protein
MQRRSVSEICALLATQPEALTSVVAGKSYMPLLVLLEHPLSVVESQLQPALMSAGISSEQRASISLERLVLFALTSWGSYWPALAVSWLEAGMPITSELAQILESLSQDKRLEQSVRHRAFALAKRWGRSHPSSPQE